MKLAEALGKIVGSIAGFLIGNAIVGGLVYFILAVVIGVHSLSFMQVWGILMLLNILHNLFFRKSR